VPPPLPSAPLVTAIHWTLLELVHAQPVGAVTTTLPVLANGPVDALAGEMLYVQVVYFMTRNARR